MPSLYSAQQHLDLLNNHKIIQLRYQINGAWQTAYFFHNSPDIKNIWLLFGGINSLALDWHRWFSEDNVNNGYLLIDYPGYGLNKGLPREKSMTLSSFEAFKALADHLKISQEVLSLRLCALGHSLGTGAAVNFALQIPLKRLILIAPFTSLNDLTIHRYGYIAGTFLNLVNPEKYDNNKALGHIIMHSSRPEIIIVHGADDMVIPVEMGRNLAAISPEKISYYEIPEMGHQNMFATYFPFIQELMNSD